jgi:hypothetical protein
VVGDHERVRHLTESQALAALGRGARVEQLLSSSNSPEVLEWLCISPRSEAVCLVRHRVQNLSTSDFRDVYEFPSIDPDEEYGEGVVLGRFTDAVEALAAARQLGARPDRWVNEGVVQDKAADVSAT